MDLVLTMLQVKKYMYLVFYYLAVHFTWFIPVLFTMISLIPWTSESVLNTMVRTAPSRVLTHALLCQLLL